MILSRRQTHLLSSLTLAVLLPLIFCLGVIFRPIYPAVDASANILFQQNGFVAVERSELGKALALTLLATDEMTLKAQTYLRPDGQITLTLKPEQDLQQPDLLVYWDQSTEMPSNISDRAQLMGTLAGPARRQFKVPNDAQGKAGYLLLYSQGTQSLAAVFSVEASLTQSSE